MGRSDGIVYSRFGTLTMNDTLFYNNTGVPLYVTTTDYVLNRCEFYDNVCEDPFGAAGIAMYYSSNGTVVDSLFGKSLLFDGQLQTFYNFSAGTFTSLRSYLIPY